MLVKTIRPIKDPQELPVFYNSVPRPSHKATGLNNEYQNSRQILYKTLHYSSRRQ